MTGTDEAAEGTAVEQVAPGSPALALVTDPSAAWTLAELLEQLAGPAAARPVEALKPAPVVRLTDKLRAALDNLPRVFGRVLPTEIRKLEKAELESLTEEAVTIASLQAELGKRAEAIDELVRHHMDALAREAGTTAPVIADGKAKGHLLLAEAGEAYRVIVEGYADPWKQVFVKGRTEQSVALLKALLDDDRITGAEANAFTRLVRVLDEDKIKAAVRRNPARMLWILAQITVRKPDTASLYSPKK